MGNMVDDHVEALLAKTGPTEEHFIFLILCVGAQGYNCVVIPNAEFTELFAFLSDPKNQSIVSQAQQRVAHFVGQHPKILQKQIYGYYAVDNHRAIYAILVTLSTVFGDNSDLINSSIDQYLAKIFSVDLHSENVEHNVLRIAYYFDLLAFYSCVFMRNYMDDDVLDVIAYHENLIRVITDPEQKCRLAYQVLEGFMQGVVYAIEHRTVHALDLVEAATFLVTRWQSILPQEACGHLLERVLVILKASYKAEQPVHNLSRSLSFHKYKKIVVRLKVYPAVFSSYQSWFFFLLGRILKDKIRGEIGPASVNGLGQAEEEQDLANYFAIFETFAVTFTDLLEYALSQTVKDTHIYYECAFQVWLQIIPAHYQMVRRYPLIEHRCKMFPRTPALFVFDSKTSLFEENMPGIDAEAGKILTYFISRITNLDVWLAFCQLEGKDVSTTLAYCDAMRGLFSHFCAITPSLRSVFSDVKAKQCFLQQVISDLFSHHRSAYEDTASVTYRLLLDSWMSLLDFAQRLGIPYGDIAPADDDSVHFFVRQIQTHLQKRQHETVWLKLVQIWMIIRDQQVEETVPLIFPSPSLANDFMILASDAQFDLYLFSIEYIYTRLAEVETIALQTAISEQFFTALRDQIATDTLPCRAHKRFYQVLAQCTATARDGELDYADCILPEVRYNPLYFQLVTCSPIGVTDPFVTTIVFIALLQSTPNKKHHACLRQLVDRIMSCKNNETLYRLTGARESNESIDSDLFYSYICAQAIQYLVAVDYPVILQQWQSIDGLVDSIPCLLSATKRLLHLRQARLRARLHLDARHSIAKPDDTVKAILAKSWLPSDLHKAVSLYYGLYSGSHSHPGLDYQHILSLQVKNRSKHLCPTEWELQYSPVDDVWYCCVRYQQETWQRIPLALIQEAGWADAFPFSMTLLVKKQHCSLVLFRLASPSGKAVSRQFPLTLYQPDTVSSVLWQDAPIAPCFVGEGASGVWHDILAGKKSLTREDAVYIEQHLAQPDFDGPVDLQQRLYKKLAVQPVTPSTILLYLKTHVLLSEPQCQQLVAQWRQCGGHETVEATMVTMLHAVFVQPDATLALSTLAYGILTKMRYQLSSIKWLHERVPQSSMQEIWYLFVKQCTTGKAPSKCLPLSFPHMDAFFQWAMKDTLRLVRYYEGYLDFSEAITSLDACHYYLTMDAIHKRLEAQADQYERLSFMILVMQCAAPESRAYQQAVSALASYSVKHVDKQAIYIAGTSKSIPLPKNWHMSSRQQLINSLRDSIAQVNYQQGIAQEQAQLHRQLGDQLSTQHVIAESALRTLAVEAPEYIERFLHEQLAQDYSGIDEAFLLWQFYSQHQAIFKDYAVYDIAYQHLLQRVYPLLASMDMTTWVDATDAAPAMRAVFLRQISALEQPSFFESKCDIDAKMRFIYQLYTAQHIPDTRDALGMPIRAYLETCHDLILCHIKYDQGMQLIGANHLIIDVPSSLVEIEHTIAQMAGTIGAYLANTAVVLKMQPWLLATAHADSLTLSPSETLLQWYPSMNTEALVDTQRLDEAQSTLARIESQLFALPLLQMSTVVDPVYWSLLPGLLPYIGPFSLTGVFAWQLQQNVAGKALTCGPITTITLLSPSFFTKSAAQQQPVIDYLDAMGFSPAAGAAKSLRYFKRWGQVALGLRIKSAPQPDEIITLTTATCMLTSMGVVIPHRGPRTLLSSHATRDRLLAQWPWSIVRIVKWILRAIPQGAQETFNCLLLENNLASQFTTEAFLESSVRSALSVEGVALVQGAIAWCSAERQNRTDDPHLQQRPDCE